MSIKMSEENACCYSCKSILKTYKIFKCHKNHTYCSDCAEEAENLCRCTEQLIERPNPNQLQAKCQYLSLGCTYTFVGIATKSYNDHIEMECKYRPYLCLLKKLNIQNCPWKNSQYKFEEHFRNTHKHFGPVLTFKEEGTFIFHPDNQQNIFHQNIHLINAFNKNFILYYRSDIVNKMISFLIILIGKKIDSSKYGYEFSFLDSNGKESLTKITFSQICYSDNHDIGKLIKDGKCVALPFYVVENYANNNKIKYFFRMMKIDIKEK